MCTEICDIFHMQFVYSAHVPRVSIRGSAIAELPGHDLCRLVVVRDFTEMVCPNSDGDDAAKTCAVGVHYPTRDGIGLTGLSIVRLTI